MRVVVMGVAGSGKSTIGILLATRLDLPFIDADDLHPASNVEKMRAGIALTDEDRWPWLDTVGEALRDGSDGLVVACSALRRAYRDRIRDSAPDAVFVELDGSRSLLAERIAARVGHFMPPSLLDSQLATLESLGEDEEGVRVSIEPGPEAVADSAVRALRGVG